MGLFDKFRRSHSHGSKLSLNAAPVEFPRAPVASRDYTKRLPEGVLERIFRFVCPHSHDYSYRTSDEGTSDACMLCDMRDLAKCVAVCKKWFLEARVLLYTNVRIDAVHYCELEITLAKKRKRRSFFDQNTEPIDAPKVRLGLFMRSVEESRELDPLRKLDKRKLEDMVESLRLPYMTRETNKMNIARTVSMLPKLRFVDLPQGLFSDEPSCQSLRLQLEKRCPDLGRMSYKKGAERSFLRLLESNPWVNLEVLELSGLYIDLTPLRKGLAAFPSLRELKLEGLVWFDDSVFSVHPDLKFPAVRSLTIRDAPNVTASGLAKMLSNPANRDTLESLTLSSTGVTPWGLHKILSAAPKLQSLSITQEVNSPFPVGKIPPLESKSLTLLHYELTSEPTNYAPKPVACYTYLITSLVAQTLPHLVHLYVRDTSFPEQLWRVPEQAILAAGEYGPRTACGLLQSLNVYSKDMDEMDWSFTVYNPRSSAPGPRSLAPRPVSFMEAQLSRPWGGDACKRVFVGNGLGGYLAVPTGNGKNMSHSSQNRLSRQDIWR